MRSVLLCCLGCAVLLFGCSGGGGAPPAASEAAVKAIRAAFPHAQVRTVVNETVAGEPVICGYAYSRRAGRFAADPFIWRNGELLTPRKLLGLGEAELRQMCGSEWVLVRRLSWAG